MIASLRALACILVAAVALAAQPARAQAPIDLPAETAAQDARAEQIAAAEAALADPETEPAELARLREELRGVRVAARALSARLAPPEDDARRALDALGPRPEEGAPAETELVVQQRAELEARLAEIDGLERRGELIATQAATLIDRINALRRDMFLTRVQARGPTPLAPAVWVNASESFFAGVGEAAAAWTAWRAGLDGAAERWGLPALALASVVVALALLGPGVGVARRLAEGLLARVMGRRPTGGLALAARALGALFAGALAAGVIFGVSEAIWGEAMRPMARALARAALLAAAARGLGEAVFAPGRPAAARPAPCRPESAGWLAAVLAAAAIVVGLDHVARTGGEALGAAAELAVTQTCVLALAFAGLMTAFGLRRHWLREPAPGAGKVAGAPRLRFALGAAAGVVVIAALAGYVALAHFIVVRATAALVAAGGFIVVRYALKDAAHELRVVGAGGAKRDQAEGDDPVAFWINAAIDATLLAAAAPIAALIAGVEAQALLDWAARAFEGVDVGPITISASSLLSAAVFFVAFLLLTRFAQRALSNRILPRTRMDEGARASLTTVTGYAGLTIAALAALGAAGLDFSQLAIIAGALSVGIGFGLQAIVSNFVSGLILLFERPIKPGDWVVLSSGEGLVKRISVRSTEIETWDLATIIVPNSELINGAVLNWTHRRRIARFAVAAGVSYDADPDHVREVLLGCAKAEPRILAFPEPYVLFMNYGDSAIEFELRFYVADAGNSLMIRNDLRFAVFRELKAAGITIPFPQRDLHIVSGLGGLAGARVDEARKDASDRDGDGEDEAP